MDYVKLGGTGLSVSRICLGGLSFGSGRDWTVDEAVSRDVIRRALKNGINFFDTADSYSQGESETLLGLALRDYARRDEVVIATKAYYATHAGSNGRGLSRKHLFSAIDGSLVRLGVDHVDLFQVHRFDNNTPVEETLEALRDLVRSGKALHIGVSNLAVWQLAKYFYVSKLSLGLRICSIQAQCSLLHRDTLETLTPFCEAEQIAMIGWAPLAHGILGGSRGAKTLRSRTDPEHGHFESASCRSVLDAVRRVAVRRKLSPAQVSLAWVLSRPGLTTAIMGATTGAQIDEAVEAVAIQLTPPEVAELEWPHLTKPPN